MMEEGRLKKNSIMKTNLDLQSGISLVLLIQGLDIELITNFPISLTAYYS